jgi:hypothetical protein
VWTKAWHDAVTVGEAAGLPPVIKATHKIRDVLNAAWLLRLEKLDDGQFAQELEVASVRLWKEIREKRESAKRPAHPAAPTTEATQGGGESP